MATPLMKELISNKKNTTLDTETQSNKLCRKTSNWPWQQIFAN